LIDKIEGEQKQLVELLSKDMAADKSNSIEHKLKYTGISLEYIMSHVGKKLYNKDVTPGDEDNIQKLLEDLQEEQMEEDINQEWLKASSDQLEDTFGQMIVESVDMDDEIQDTKFQIIQEIKQQREAINEMNNAGAVTDEDGGFNSSYLSFLEGLFMILTVLGLFFSCVCGGACAFFLNKKCMRAGESDE